MSKAWNPKSFTVTELSVRLGVCYNAALHLLSALCDAGMAVATGEQKRLRCKGAALYKLTARPVKGRTRIPEAAIRADGKVLRAELPDKIRIV